MWWRHGILYQVYPRSFADGNGDGIGDLPGLTGRLDHVQWLGVDGIWLNPTMPSPNADWGFDVADYCAVHPDLGTMEDLDRLVAEAGRRGMRILLDLVPNHTSEQHPWFVDALSGRDATHRGHYVWADPAPDGGPPNNWRSAFDDSPAWTLHEPTGQYYLHNFTPQQPDLDWWNGEVSEEFDRILRFWFDRGIAGFRIDVAHAIIKDRELRDDPPSSEHDHPMLRERELKNVYSMNRPEGHDVLRAWRRLADGYDGDRVLLGETWVMDLESLVRFYGPDDDELHLAFNFPFVFADLDPGQMRPIVEAIEEALPATAWPVWTGSNHDAGRLATRWANGDERLARCALMMLLTLRGTPVLYQGDEIALTDGEVPAERVLDVAGRDPCRTPMPWEDAEDGGWRDPWLPVGDTSRNVASQRADSGSTLHLVRDLIALRRAEEDLHAGTYETHPAPDGAWAWHRGRGFVTAVNLGSEPAELDVRGRIEISTGRDRDGDDFDGRLAPAEGVVVRR